MTLMQLSCRSCHPFFNFVAAISITCWICDMQRLDVTDPPAAPATLLLYMLILEPLPQHACCTLQPFLLNTQNVFLFGHLNSHSLTSSIDSKAVTFTQAISQLQKQ